MRALAGLIALHGLLLCVGTSFVIAARLAAPKPRELLAAIGVAHLAGIALTSLVVIVLLVAGATVTAPVFVVVAVVLTVLLLALARWRAARARGTGEVEPPALQGAAPASRERSRLAIVLGVAIAAFIAAQMIGSRDLPTAWDAGHNWTLKAAVLAADGDLSSGAFQDDGLFAGAHPAYPILQPVFASILFRFVGHANQGLLVAELWLLLGALTAAALFLIRPSARLQPLVLALLGVALASGAAGGVMRGDADVTLAVFLAGGALCCGLWLERARPGLLPLAALLLAAAANTKNEGLVFSVVVLAVAALASLLRPRRDLRPLGVCAAAVVAAMLPWRLWVADHGPFKSDTRPLGEALDPGLLADSLHQLDLGAQAVIARLVDGSAAGWIVPALIVVAVALLVAGERRRVVAFHLGALLVAVAALLWVYWTSPQPDVAAHIERTSLRTITGPLFMAALALAHLMGRLEPRQLLGPLWPGDDHELRREPGSLSSEPSTPSPVASSRA